RMPGACTARRLCVLRSRRYNFGCLRTASSILMTPQKISTSPRLCGEKTIRRQAKIPRSPSGDPPDYVTCPQMKTPGILTGVLIILTAVLQIQDTSDMDKEHRHTNQLIHSTSPYLLQHAHNPVNWYPWGDEALELAKKEDKPILVSIGYSTCHWCHVMERESFENEEI